MAESEAAVQCVDVGDVGERYAGGQVRELAPRRCRHAVPRVPAEALLRVHHHGWGLANLSTSLHGIKSPDPNFLTLAFSAAIDPVRRRPTRMSTTSPGCAALCYADTPKRWRIRIRYVSDTDTPRIRF